MLFSGGDEGSEEGSRSGKSKLEALTEEAKLGNVTAVVGKVREPHLIYIKILLYF
jgi:hypothetical protein